MDTLKRLITLLSAASCALLLSGCFFSVDHDFIAIRDDALPSDEIAYKKQFQHKIGKGVLGFASKFMDEEDSAEKEFLKGLKSVQIGVYELEDSYDPELLRLQTDRLDAHMRKQGYYAIVKARDAGEYAGVYAPVDDVDELSELIVCAMESNEVVLVQVTGDLNNLAPMIAQGETDIGLN